MKRAPIVIASTIVGVGLVLAYHPTGPTITGSNAMSLGATSVNTDPATAAAPVVTTTPTDAATRPATSATPSSHAPTTAVPAKKSPPVRTQATGTLEHINEQGREFGQIQVKATVESGKVVGVQIVQLQPNDGRSQSIDDYAVPRLEQQTIGAGSAQIDGISGATYTSQGYAASLQAALDKLGV
jgi:uncharacterized protein with FMN-binding domain